MSESEQNSDNNPAVHRHCSTVSLIDFQMTVANLSVAEHALREEPYERLPYLAGTMQVAQSQMECLRQEALELKRVLHIAREACRENLAYASCKNEKVLYEAFKLCNEILEAMIENEDGTENLGALRSSTAFNYESIRSLPVIVRQLCFNHDAWVVGGAAKFMCGLSGQPRDWDVIVPLHEWMQASKQFPFGSKVNTLGGVKVESDGFEIDVWADDVGRYFQTAGGSFDLIAVSPKTQQVCTCTKR